MIVGDTLLDQLRSWDDIHRSIGEIVRNLNRCFGPTLLANLIFTFTSSVTGLYYVINSPVQSRNFMYILNCVYFLAMNQVSIGLIFYVADQIDIEVI